MKLVKRGKIWWVDYTANGIRHRQSTGCTSRALALTWMNQIDVARKMPSFEAAVDVLKHFYDKAVEGLTPIEAIWGEYERLARATGKDAISADTIRKRRSTLKRFTDWLAEKRAAIRTLEHVSGPIAAAFAEHLNDDLGLKTKTRRNIIGDLSAIWNLLEKLSTGAKNPWTNLAPPDVDGEAGKAFTDEQEAAILASAAKIGLDWYPVCQIMRFTGLRYGDVATMEWKEVQTDAIRLDPNKNRTHNRIRRSKKISVAIPIIEPLQKVLDEIPRRGDFLFPMHSECYGRPGAQTRAGLLFSRVLKAAGITGSGYTIHSWRHTAATRLAAAGADLETRKRILGHTEDVTARRYDHDEHLAEQREALERTVSGRRTPTETPSAHG